MIKTEYFESRLCPACLKPKLKRTADPTKVRCDACRWHGPIKAAAQLNK